MGQQQRHTHTLNQIREDILGADLRIVGMMMSAKRCDPKFRASLYVGSSHINSLGLLFGV